MVIATFGPITGWAGKTIAFENGQFTLEGHGPITAQDVLEYDRQGQLVWAYDGLREWVAGLVTQPPVPTPPQPLVQKPLEVVPVQPLGQRPQVGAGKPRRRVPGWVWALVAALVIVIVVAAIAGSGGTGGGSSGGPTGGHDAAVPTAESVEEPADSQPAEEPAAEEPAEPGLTMGQQQAVQSAQSYLDMGGFSRKGLIEQLVFEGFSKTEAEFAVDHIGPDWNAQAAQSAESYVDMGGFSRKALIEQLVFEGFTQAQAEYGVKAVGY